MFITSIGDTEMPRHFDKEVQGPGIASREHVLGRSLGGRARYPFKALVTNDYFKVHDKETATKVRNALKSFKRRYPTRVFTVRPMPTNYSVWVVRRVL